MEGILNKWTNLVKGWQYRWFVLDRKSGQLVYYTSKERSLNGYRRGSINLRGALVAVEDENSNTFNVTGDLKTLHLQASNKEELLRWLSALEDVILAFARQRGSPGPAKVSASPCNDVSFGKKLAESCMFVHILNEQINNLDIKMELNPDPGRKLVYSRIIAKSKKMLNEIKHTINLLKIAKCNAQTAYEKYNSNHSFYFGTDISKQYCTSQDSDDDTEKSVSSIGEEDYFDAHDLLDCRSLLKYDLFNQGSQECISDTNNPKNESSTIISNDKSGNNVGYSPLVDMQGSDDAKNMFCDSATTSTVVSSERQLDYDALYENSDTNVTSLENQGSVLAHLLSQVKIGMDLTKVALPTYILETRSLLEMFADYFAHPDMFVRITDMPTPRERMIQVVRWYLCSYHAGRKCSIAKKPYNPILGEFFQCHWDIPEIDSQSNQSTGGGPLQWCTANQLVYVAEQVSHHPPISAFYAEHYNKRISFNAHVWTKSKFLGLSIGVQNIGHGVIKVLEYGEEYIVTFPNGYGRSILTVPWIELGGSVSIICEKSGYRANLEFLTKPFYGGKKHRIYGEVFGPDDKEAFMKLTGEWNDKIEVKWPDGSTDLFADVNQLKAIKKIVRPIVKQDEMESRRLWKEVTAGLKLNDIDRATNAKLMLEQKQRSEAQQRKELGLEWNPKMFNKLGDDSWIYVRPLSERLNDNKYEVLNS